MFISAQKWPILSIMDKTRIFLKKSFTIWGFSVYWPLISCIISDKSNESILRKPYLQQAGVLGNWKKLQKGQHRRFWGAWGDREGFLCLARWQVVWEQFGWGAIPPLPAMEKVLQTDRQTDRSEVLGPSSWARGPKCIDKSVCKHNQLG